MTGTSAVRATLRIRGKVQGVFYRASTQQEAARRGLTGWVRNEPDGSVQAVVEGPEDQVDGFVRWCHRGPEAADVEAVDDRRSAATGEFDSFDVVR